MSGKTDYGKGDAPREHQYSAKSQKAFAEGYDRIYNKCRICKGKGFHVDYDKIQRKPVKTTCIICYGSGKINREK